jgi:hypothetical protein
MSSTAILYYLGYLPLPSQSASYTNQLNLGPINTSGYLEYLTDASLAVVVHEIDPNNHVQNTKTPTNEIASLAINHIDNDQPVILNINFTNRSGNSLHVGTGYHAVVAWGYVKEPNGDVVFLVYDPNYPQIITRAIYYSTNGSFIYIDGYPPYSIIVNGHKFSYPGDVGEVIGVASPTPASLTWFIKYTTSWPQILESLLGLSPLVVKLLAKYTLYVSTSPINVYTGGLPFFGAFSRGELVGYFVDNKYFVTAPTVQPGDLAGYVDGFPGSPLYIVAVRNDYNAVVDPNSTLVVLRFTNASGTITVNGFVVNSTQPVAVQFINESSFIVASQNNTAVKLELFSVSNSSVKTYNTTLSLTNRTGYMVSANFTKLTNITIKNVTVSWENITPTQTATTTTTTTSSSTSSVTTSTTASISASTTSTSTMPTPSAVPTWAVVAIAVIVVVIAALLVITRRKP